MRPASHTRDQVAQVARVLGGTRIGTGFLVHCPVLGHGKGRGDRSPRLSIAEGDGGTLLVRRFAGCDSREVLAALRKLGLNDAPERDRAERPAATKGPPHNGLTGNTARSRQAHEILRECRSAEGSLVETYLRSRGLSDPIPVLIRSHPALRHADTGLLLPAMVCAVQGADGETTAIHRTFLKADGSGEAPATRAKMMLGPCHGGTVRLAAAGRKLAIGKRLETCLSVRQSVPGLAVWSALSAPAMMSVAIPAHVRDLVIFADSDEAGEAAARALARRPDNAGRTVRIARPPSGFRDFNVALVGAPVDKAEAYG